ncbi:MAG: L-lactate dehydrogenase [Clostridiaceae bacterium]|nr:L-lactate dehydrogenase [Clostridiaceae bacterium]
MTKGKCVIIGAGAVGSTTAYTLMLSGLFKEIALIDVNMKKAEGEALDMNHGLVFAKPVKIHAAGYETCKDADIIIITAGIPRKEGDSRLDLLKKNKEIFDDIISNILKNVSKEPIVLVVSNPVDVLTYVTYKLTGFSKNKVFGTGTVLDTSRFRYLLAEHTGIDSRNIHTYVLGEHGDSEVAALSATYIAGMSIDDFCKVYGRCSAKSLSTVHQEVKVAGQNIISKKGATFYAIALGIKRICEAIVNDENSILTVSSVLDGQYGIRDVSMSLPTVVYRKGIKSVLEVPLSNEEIEGLKNSAQVLRNALNSIGF